MPQPLPGDRVFAAWVAEPASPFKPPAKTPARAAECTGRFHPSPPPPLADLPSLAVEQASAPTTTRAEPQQPASCSASPAGPSDATPAAVSNRDRMLHVFAGAERAGSFEDVGVGFNVVVDGVDVLRDKVKHNVLAAPTRAALLAAVRARVYEVVWIGTPCSSCSVLWLSGTERPPGSRPLPDGVRGLPAWQRRYLELHNELIAFSEELAMAAFEAGVTFVIENPVDYGAVGTTHFRWDRRATARCGLLTG